MGTLRNFAGRVFCLAPAILLITSGIVFETSWCANWSEINTGLPKTGVRVSSIVIPAKTSSTIYARTFSPDGTGGGLFKSTDAAASWKAIGSVVGVGNLVADPQNPSTVYALTTHGILKSTNGGDSWVRAGSGLPDTYINDLVINPVTTSTLYALSGYGPTGAGIYKTTNGGQSWNALDTGFPRNTFINSLAIDPTTPSSLYAIGSAPQFNGPPSPAIFKSTDGGGSWNALKTDLAPNLGIRSLIFAPTTPGTIYALTNVFGPGGRPGIFKTTDGGESWTGIDTGVPPGAFVSSMVLDPKDPAVIYLAVVFPFAEAGGILKSSDGGKSWRAISTGLPANTPLQSLAIDPVNSSTLYMISEGTLFKSTDGGTRWNKAVNGLAVIGVGALAVNRVDATIVYAAAGDSLFKSPDAGATWNKLFTFQISTVPGAFFALPFAAVAPGYPRSLLIDFANPDTLYTVTTRGNGCYFADNLILKSTDGGASWSDSVSPDRSGCVLGGFFGVSAGLKAIDPTDPNTLYLAEADDEDGGYGLLRSKDGGASWTPVGDFPGGQQAGVWALAIDPSNPATIFEGLDDVPMYSEDGVKPGAGGVFKSTDGGASWKSIGLSGAAVNRLAIDPANPNVLYASTIGNYGTPRGFRGLFKSTDSGASWAAINNGLASLIDTGYDTTAIVIDALNSNLLYLGTSGGGVFKSSNGGANWTQLNGGLTNLDVRSLASAPGSRRILYAGTSGGVFRLIDDTP